MSILKDCYICKHSSHFFFEDRGVWSIDFCVKCKSFGQNAFEEFTSLGNDEDGIIKISGNWEHYLYGA